MENKFVPLVIIPFDCGYNHKNNILGDDKI